MFQNAFRIALMVWDSFQPWSYRIPKRTSVLQPLTEVRRKSQLSL